MRFVYTLVLTLLLTISVFTQANQEIFGLKGKIGLDKGEAVIQLVPLDSGNRLLLVSKNQLQFWDIRGARLIGSSPHKITGYWTGGLLMKIASFPNTTGFPMVMNQNRMKVSPDGSIGITLTKDDARSTGKDKTRAAVVWNLNTGESLGGLLRGLRPIREAEFSRDGSTIITIHGDLKDSELAFWDAKALTHRTSIRVKNLTFYHLGANGEQVFIGSAEANKWMGVTVVGYDPSEGIELWNARTGKLEKKFEDGPAKFRSAIFVSPDGKYLVDRADGDKIVVWETAGDGAPKYRIDQPAARINHGIMGISQDSRYLLTKTKNEARVYELASGNLYRRFPIREEASYKLSADSRYAIMRAEGWVAGYDLEKEKISFANNLKTETQHRENEANTEFEVESPAISPDSKFLMIYGADHVRIYDLATGDLVQTLIDAQRAKYDSKGKLKDAGLETGGTAGWLASGDSIYVSGSDGRSFYLWSRN